MTRYLKLYAALVGAAGTVAAGVGTHGSWSEALPAALGAAAVWWLKNEEPRP